MNEINPKRPIPLAPNDMMFGYVVKYMLDRYPKIINSNINTIDALELLIYTDLMKYLQTEKVQIDTKKCDSIAKKFISQVKSSDIIKDLSEEKVQHQYNQKLWEEIAVLRRNDRDFVMEMLDFFDDGTNLLYILRQKVLLNKYEVSIFERLRHNPDAIKIIYINETAYSNWQKKIPANIRDEIVYSYLENIAEDNPDQYLENIKKDKKLNPVLRARAADLDEKLIDNYFSKNPNSGTVGEFKISLVKLISNEKIEYKFETIDENKILTTINLNSDTLDDYLNKYDNLGIFVYLINIVGYIDQCGFIQPVIKREDDGVITRTICQKESDEFQDLPALRHRELIGLLILRVVYDYLEGQGIRFESVLNSTWNGYIVSELNSDNFDVEIPIPTSSVSKSMINNAIAAQMQRAVKLWNTAVLGEKINTTLINNYVSMPNYDEIYGLRDCTYIKLTSEKAKLIQTMLNSDQSLLYDFKHSITFDELISNNEIEYNNLIGDDLQKQPLDSLLDASIIKKNNAGVLSYVDPIYSFIFRTSFCYGEIPYSPYLLRALDTLKEIGVTYSKSNSLFAAAESSYFNYVLASKYSNSIGLRNKYAHGSANGLTDSQYDDDYFRLLYCFVLLTLKALQEIGVSKNEDKN